MSRVTRRAFLGSGAMVFFGAAFAEPVKKIKRRKISANDKVNIAGVGCGGKGKSDVSAVAARNNIVALCDVDDERAAETFKVHPDVPKYKDFRVMLDKEGKHIDAVTVSTPDHMHAIIAMTAMQMGKHVYVQKPLTHDIWEARQLQKMAQEYKVATQMGNQGHAGPGVRRITEWLDAGIIGPVKTVMCWTNRPTWPQGGLTRPEKMDVPATLDWDLWLGTAPDREYNKAYLPHNWRGWWDFGCGALGDMGCHIMDPAYTSLKLGYPTSVEATSEGNTEEGGPKSSTVKYEFPARGDKPPVTFLWYDGGVTPKWPDGIPADAQLGDKDNCGTLFVGDKGFITCGTYGGEPRLVPYAKPGVEPTIPNSPGHYVEWIEACKGGAPAGGNFDYAGPFAEMVLLGNIAIRVGQKIEYNAEEMKITNVPDANKYIKRDYRKGWTV